MARQQNSFDDPGLLEAALEGLNLQKARIEAQIQDIRSRLGRRRGAPVKAAGPAPQGRGGSRPEGRKRTLSESARKRIAAAQKKRWAEYRKSQSRGEQ
ncbi:MAG TPA: hypothetical protein VES20_24730 [Bryobacteraceae bacterium]|nr:hypothetical protein [Bryobacteraceae bacterium]